MHRPLSSIALFAALSLSLVGCGGEQAPATATPAGEDAAAAETSKHETRDTLVIGYQSDIGNLISVVSETAADGEIMSALSFPLVDSEFDCSLKKLPGMATEWSWSDDGKTLRMTLRDDLKYEDGSPVTAEDIVFTYDLISDPNVASARISYVERMEETGRPAIIDDTHIEWHFTESYDRDTQMAHASSMALLPKKHLADADRSTLRGHPMSKAPLSYGPWRLSKWEPNNRIVLEPNPHFSGPADWQPHLNRVIFKILPEYSTRLIELEAGNIDMMNAILVRDADRLRTEHPEINLVRRGWRSNDYVAWNLKNPLFADKAVRVALAHAIDVDKMIGKLLTSETGEVYAKRSIGTVTPALCGVHNDDVKPFGYDPEKAKTMLAEAGWTDTDGDGTLDKDGKPFAFTLSTNTGNQRRADIQILVQAQLQQIGIKADLEKAESNAFFDNLREKKFDAAVAGWSAGLFVDPSTIWHCDKEDKSYPFNFPSYCNEKVDELIEKGLHTANPKDAAPYWKEMQAEIYADQPYLFLWWMDEIVGINERFENTQIDVLSATHNLHQWEVPADKVKYKH
ncbi:MAG: hypothetical protein GWP91_13680 [Rhodobacterales bacterium]|nr:hypothetical protein [Rhodobacterales bacterium]